MPTRGVNPLKIFVERVVVLQNHADVPDNLSISKQEILRLKVAQNPYAKEKLHQTGDYPLVEALPNDSFLG